MKSIDLSPLLHSANFEEGWKALSYTYAGTFILDGQSLTSDRILNDISELLNHLKKNRMAKYPRFLSRYVVVIIYCFDEVSEEVMNYLKITNFGGLKWSAHAILYKRKSGIVFKEAVQNQTLLIYENLERWFDAGGKLAQQLDT